MSMFGGSGLPGGAHDDVLAAMPTDDVSKSNLVEELKRRAKGSIGSKNYPEAILLYTKALDMVPAKDTDIAAIVHANRSMCHMSKKDGVKALDDADRAIALDSSYAKGYYRKGAAHMHLKQYKSAHDALQEGLALVPTDASMLKQRDVCMTELDRRARSGEALDGDAAKGPAAAAKPKPKPVGTKTAASKPAAASKANVEASTTAAVGSSSGSTTDDAANADGDADAETIGGHVRGYKTTSDGRKTTFFNNEMDERTKALIGDITPKAIVAGTTATAAPAADGTSAWNTAGTFESRDHSSWARDTATQVLKPVTFSLPGAMGSARVSKVTKMEGDAEVASARGKTKHIYDLTATLEWELTLLKPEDPAYKHVCSGTMTLLDITGDMEYESQSTIDKGVVGNADAAALVKTYIRTDGKGLSEVCYAALRGFHDTFKQKH